MTFKELAFQEELKLSAPLLRNPDEDSSPLRALLANQSPVMKLWFVIMALNLVMFLCLIHS